MPSSEKIGQGQFLLFDEAELVTDPDVIAHEQDDKLTTHTKKSAPRGRKPFAADLPREQIFLYLTDEERMGAKSTFFAKVKEELDIVPAKIRVLEYMQEKAVLAEEADSDKMVAAALPKHLIKGAMGSIGLPLYRIEKQLSRYGGNISRATLGNYVIKSAHVLQPIINLMWDKQHEGNVIAMDETPLQVLKEPGKAATSKKYMWVSLGGLPGQQSVLYHYDPSRSGQVPRPYSMVLKGICKPMVIRGITLRVNNTRSLAWVVWTMSSVNLKMPSTLRPRKKLTKPIQSTRLPWHSR